MEKNNLKELETQVIPWYIEEPRGTLHWKWTVSILDSIPANSVPQIWL